MRARVVIKLKKKLTNSWCQIRDKGLTPLADMATKNFDFINSVNTRGLLHCVQAEVRAMRGQELIYPLEGRPGVRGSIVNIASVGSIVPVSGQAAYTISKHAVIGITRSAGMLNHCIHIDVLQFSYINFFFFF